jgi:Flp pilus assembly protein TadG
MRNENTDKGRPLNRSFSAERYRGDTGAILAEATLLTPVFLVLLFGILEFGGLFRDYLTLNNATSAGGRMASIAGNATTADQQTLNSIEKEISAMPLWQVQRIVIFHASGPTASVPAPCLSGNTGNVGTNPGYVGACNVYTTSPDWSNLPDTSFGCTSSTLDQYWCPGVRKVAALAALGNGPPDYVGIYVQIKHKFYTGLFGQDLTQTKTTIYRIEPEMLK